MLPEQQRKRVFNIIIVNQCLGMLVGVLFQNGFYLNYFSKLGIASENIPLLFSLPPMLGAILMLPFAFFSDRFGKLKLALSGQMLVIFSLAVMVMAGVVSPAFSFAAVVVALLFFCWGSTFQASSWFALMSPIVPRAIRGRFFGRLRVTFMTTCILFTFAVTQVLSRNDSLNAFLLLLSVVFVASIFRLKSFSMIPELESERNEGRRVQHFWDGLKNVFRVPGFVQFNSYLFLLTLFTAAVPIIFGLMQKDVFKFSPAQIVLVGNFFLVGSVAGNWIGGHAVDRFGTKRVFLFAHISYGFVLLFMLCRHWMPWSFFMHSSICSLGFSFIAAVAGIAVTSEVMALIPAKNKSLSTAVNMSLLSLAIALSQIFVSRSLSWNMFSPAWSMAGRDFTAYDSILLLFAILILLMLATIGLVPKMVKQVQRIPGGTFPKV